MERFDEAAARALLLADSLVGVVRLLVTPWQVHCYFPPARVSHTPANRQRERSANAAAARLARRARQEEHAARLRCALAPMAPGLTAV